MKEWFKIVEMVMMKLMSTFNLMSSKSVKGQQQYKVSVTFKLLLLLFQNRPYSFENSKHRYSLSKAHLH